MWGEEEQEPPRGDPNQKEKEGKGSNPGKSPLLSKEPLAEKRKRRSTGGGSCPTLRKVFAKNLAGKGKEKKSLILQGRVWKKTALFG